MSIAEKPTHLKAPSPRIYEAIGIIVHPYLKWMRRMSVSGTDNLPGHDEAYLLAIKHASNWDSLAVSKTLLDFDGSHARFVTKKQTTDNPVIGGIVRSSGAIRFDRDLSMADQPEVSDEIAEVLYNNGIPVVCPERTRSKGPELQIDKHKRGLGMVAVANSVPIAVAGVYGTRSLSQLRHIHIHFGATARPGDYSDDYERRRVVTRMEHDYTQSLQEATYEAYRRGGGAHLLPDHAQEGGS